MIRRQQYKIVMYILCAGAILYILGLAWWYFAVQATDKSHLAPKIYDATIVNQNMEFSPTDANPNPYEIAFLRIKNISFYTDNDYAYFRFGLGGTLPKTSKGLPTFENDQLTDLSFDMTLDDNYFDSAGNKNPGGPGTELKISLYGNQDNGTDNRITVNGELIKGGPDHDYFVVRYPYRDILFDQQRSYIVFTARSIVNSKQYPTGASSFEFSNKLLAATPENSKEVMIDLSLKDVKY